MLPIRLVDYYHENEKLYFSKMTSTNFPIFILFTMWFGHSSHGEVGVCFLLLNLVGFVTNGNNSKLLRTGYKNAMHLCLFLLRYSNPAVMLWGSLSSPWRCGLGVEQRPPAHNPGWALSRGQHQFCEWTILKLDSPVPRRASPADATWTEMVHSYWDSWTQLLFSF